jgi:hypothetical protein
MAPKVPAKPRTAPHPDDFPLGSPESRAAARTLAQARASQAAPSADRTIRILSHIPGRPARTRTGTFVQPNGKTVTIIIDPASPHADPALGPDKSAAPQPIEKHPQNKTKGEKP